MEFDVRSLPRRPLGRVMLNLQDSASTSAGEPQITDMLGYTGDGSLTADDWGIAASLVVTINRPDRAGTTRHDVTGFVNARLLAGDDFIGFRFEPGDPATFDAFGFWGELTFE
jgi:hypothetical protein